jgi:hypothetical protein
LAAIFFLPSSVAGSSTAADKLCVLLHFLLKELGGHSNLWQGLLHAESFESFSRKTRHDFLQGKHRHDGSRTRSGQSKVDHTVEPSAGSPLRMSISHCVV